MKTSTLFIGLWLFVSCAALASEAITEKNWVNHPEIVDVRTLYQKIKKSKDAGHLKRNERKFDTTSCEPYEDDVRVLFTDQKGKPRELFYDDNGKLRFAFVRAGAYNGTKLEHRVYFSKAGKKIWEIQKLLKGPGYTFPTEWPDAELIQNPVQAFNDKSPCKETK
ncbi:MAG: hypothetical protein E6H57_12820 [Betaproteobacteria bacterium]|nr:MAG: hypothetical protein E6H57_12820 [Betaproteobacteria bacterium]